MIAQDIVLFYLSLMHQVLLNAGGSVGANRFDSWRMANPLPLLKEPGAKRKIQKNDGCYLTHKT